MELGLEQIQYMSNRLERLLVSILVLMELGLEHKPLVMDNRSIGGFLSLF